MAGALDNVPDNAPPALYPSVVMWVHKRTTCDECCQLPIILGGIEGNSKRIDSLSQLAAVYLTTAAELN